MGKTFFPLPSPPYKNICPSSKMWCPAFSSGMRVDNIFHAMRSTADHHRRPFFEYEGERDTFYYFRAFLGARCVEWQVYCAI